jgi:hypothetical protein
LRHKAQGRDVLIYECASKDRGVLTDGNLEVEVLGLALSPVTNTLHLCLIQVMIVIGVGVWHILYEFWCACAWALQNVVPVEAS